MERRQSLLALVVLGLAAGSPAAWGQERRSDAPARIAILDDAPPATREALWVSFRRGLAQLGYVEGRNLQIEQRWADGDVARLPALAAELVGWKPDVFVVVTTTVAIAAKKATSTIPIVALGPADPVKSGLVESLGRPGGNLTGMAPNQGEIAGKWADLAREIAPRAKSIAYLTDVGNPGEMVVFRGLEERARAAGFEAEAMDGIDPAKVEQSLAAMKRKRTDVLIVAITSSLVPQRRQIVDGAASLRIPAIYARKEYTDVGGLISFGPDTTTVYASAADYVHRILRGAKPADLPFVMASTYRFVVNLKTAQALGLQIPRAVLLRADEVIRE